MYLNIVTDGTERNTFVKTAVDGYPLRMLSPRAWITDDGNVGLTFEIDTDEILRRSKARPLDESGGRA